MVYSVADKVSFDELLEFQNQILLIKKVDDVPIVLCANKCDLEENDETHPREVAEYEGKNRAQEWNCPFYEVSALSNENVEFVFTYLFERIYQNRLNGIDLIIKDNKGFENESDDESQDEDFKKKSTKCCKLM